MLNCKSSQCFLTVGNRLLRDNGRGDFSCFHNKLYVGQIQREVRINIDQDILMVLMTDGVDFNPLFFEDEVLDL